MVRTSVALVRGTVIALAIGLAPVTSLAAKAPAAAKAAAAKKAPVKKAPVSIEERAASLKPGHWVWRPELAPGGAIDIVVSLPLQMAYVFRGGTLVGATTVSTGQPGYDTPTGKFAILQKRKDHRSNLYDDAPMPYMQRLTWDGVALHGGAIPGRPASHGCVRLPHKFAAKLFEATELGANVVIVDEAPSPDAAYAMATGRTFETAMGGPEEEVEESPAIAEMRRTVDGLTGKPQ
jgi:lipoprotein-anchoring transpeptidase ErfK/SrfK